MFDIRHENTSNGVAYDAPIAQLWLELPSGAKLFFADVEHFEYDSDAEREKAVENVKAGIGKMLQELREMHMSDSAVHNEPAYTADPCSRK